MRIFTKPKQRKRVFAGLLSSLPLSRARGGRGSYLTRPAPLSPAPRPLQKRSADVTRLRQRRPGPASECPKAAPEPVTRGGRAGGGGDPALEPSSQSWPPTPSLTDEETPAAGDQRRRPPPRCTPRARHAPSTPEWAASSRKTSETAPCTHHPCALPGPILSLGPHGPSPWLSFGPTPGNG